MRHYKVGGHEVYVISNIYILLYGILPEVRALLFNLIYNRHL